MTETLVILGSILGVLISIITIARLLFYTKAEINTKIEAMLEHSDLKDEGLKQYLINKNTIKPTTYVGEIIWI